MHHNSYVITKSVVISRQGEHTVFIHSVYTLNALELLQNSHAPNKDMEGVGGVRVYIFLICIQNTKTNSKVVLISSVVIRPLPRYGES